MYSQQWRCTPNPLAHVKPNICILRRVTIDICITRYLFTEEEEGCRGSQEVEVSQQDAAGETGTAGDGESDAQVSVAI